MATYNYSISTHFAGILPVIFSLTNQINGSIVSPALTSISFLGDTVEIIFASSLSAPQIIILNNICSPGSYPAELSCNYNSTDVKINLIPQGVISLKNIMRPNCITQSSVASTSTSSSSYGLMDTMSINPSPSTYLVTFTSVVNLASTSATGSYAIFVNGIMDGSSERTYSSGSTSTGIRHSIVTEALVTVNTGIFETISVRWKTTSGTFRAYQREMSLISVA